MLITTHCRWAAEALQQRQQMADDAANAGRATDAARAEELTVRQQLVELRAQASRSLAEVGRRSVELSSVHR